MADISKASTYNSVPKAEMSYFRKSSGFRKTPTVPFQIKIREDLKPLGKMRSEDNNVRFKPEMTSKGVVVNLFG